MFCSAILEFVDILSTRSDSVLFFYIHFITLARGVHFSSRSVTTKASLWSGVSLHCLQCIINTIDEGHPSIASKGLEGPPRWPGVAIETPTPKGPSSIPYIKWIDAYHITLPCSLCLLSLCRQSEQVKKSEQGEVMNERATPNHSKQCQQAST